MTQRKEKFKTFAKFDFSELIKIEFKSGHQPRNATDYYYHLNTKTVYSYYWGGGDNATSGKWDIKPDFNMNNVKSPLNTYSSSESETSENDKHVKKLVNKIKTKTHSTQNLTNDTYRKEKFKTLSKLNFSDLIKIEFKSGHQPRNATDYYYHAKTKTFYSYYWGDGDKLGKWNIDPRIDKDGIASSFEEFLEHEASSEKKNKINKKTLDETYHDIPLVNNTNNDTYRKEKFNTFTKLNFDDLTKIEFNAEKHPRNATDYYYHFNTKIVYSYYWGYGDKLGKWDIDSKSDSKIDSKIDSKNVSSSLESESKNKKHKSSKSKNNKRKTQKENETYSDDEACKCIIL